MTWLVVKNKINEIDPKYAAYIDRYMQEVPIEVQKRHNHFFPEYLMFPRIHLYINQDSNDEAMLFFYDQVINPGEDAPGAVALFIEDQIIPIHYTTKGLFWDKATKESGIEFQIMPFTVPDTLKNKQEKVKQVLEEALICMQSFRYRNDPFINYTK